MDYYQESISGQPSFYTSTKLLVHLMVLHWTEKNQRSHDHLYPKPDSTRSGIQTMKRRLILTTALALGLSSCSTKFTEAQRAQLSTVKVQNTLQSSDAYSDPLGTADGTAGAVGMATGGGLVGALIGGAVEMTQNSMFKNAEGKNFAKLKAQSPKQVGSIVNQQVSATLKANPFFASRLKSTSPNSLKTEVTNYTLTRTGKDTNGLLMSPKIVATAEFIGHDGKRIGKAFQPSIGVSSMSYPVSTYLAKPSLLKKGYAEAAANLGNNFANQLAQRTAE